MMRMGDEREKGKEKTSECSSGSQSQSGWTMYLDDHHESNENYTPNNQTHVISIEEEEEDLSMISDASSGPPNFHDKANEEHYCYCRNHECFEINGTDKKRRVVVEADCSSSLLDDTASSPFFTFSKTNCNNAITTSTKNKKKLTQEELSCGFSATHFKGKPALGRHLGGYRQSSDPVKVKPHTVCRGEGERKVW